MTARTPRQLVPCVKTPKLIIWRRRVGTMSSTMTLTDCEDGVAERRPPRHRATVHLTMVRPRTNPPNRSSGAARCALAACSELQRPVGEQETAAIPMLRVGSIWCTLEHSAGGAKPGFPFLFQLVTGREAERLAGTSAARPSPENQRTSP